MRADCLLMDAVLGLLRVIRSSIGNKGSVVGVFDRKAMRNADVFGDGYDLVETKESQGPQPTSARESRMMHRASHTVLCSKI